jgi:hypothetical protein
MICEKIFNFFKKSNNKMIPEIIVPYIEKHHYKSVSDFFSFSKEDINESLKTDQTQYSLGDWKKYPESQINLVSKDQLLKKLNI